MEKNFTCKTCSKGYKHKRSLTRHFRDSGHSNSHTENIHVDHTSTVFKYDLEENTRKIYLKVITIRPKAEVFDPTVFINNLSPDLIPLINNSLNDTQSTKIQLSLCAVLFKPTTETEIEASFNSKMQTVYGEGLTKSIFKEVKKQVLKRL